jgi:perosamine synthetase
LTGREREYVNDCLESTWISSRGNYVAKFEARFAEFLGAAQATSVCNGTVALHLALLALGIQPGDEIIVPTLTYVASANMILHAGATPVFVDSLPDTWQMDPAAIERAITPKTKAIMVVHLYGGACDMRAISDICTRHGLLLVEDCAEALGTRCCGDHVGTFGDVATFSFFGNKTLTTGEGGMVVSNNRDVIDKAYHLKTQAVCPDREYWHDMLGFNYRMTNICAAIGLAQLEHIDDILGRKQQIARWYDRYLAGLPVTRQSEEQKNQHSWWLYSVLVSPDRRDDLRNHLRENGIETRSLFPPVHAMPHFAGGTHLPIAEDLSRRGINLPSYPEISEDDVRFIAESIGQFFSRTTEASRKVV